MKKIILTAIAISTIVSVQAQQMKIVTIVESIVPMGIGRSRIIEHHGRLDVADFTTDRTDGKKSDQKDIKRQDLRINKLSETKLLNFYSGVGINFQNIASNDALISSKINTMISEGWSLKFITSGVESSAGYGDINGIFITRLYFSKEDKLL